MVKVSIIVPVYNASKHVGKCIESILAQTFADFELILINDGSTDDSLKVIETYREKDRRIKIIDQKNQGVAKTRNKGMQLAKGKYIAFVDNDDYLDCDYIEKLYTIISSNKGDLVLTGYRRITKDKKILHLEKLKDTPWSKYIITAPWAKMYRTAFLTQNKIEFLNYPIGEDVYFNLSIYAKKPKIVTDSYIGYNWFYNEESVSNTSQKGLNKKVDILTFIQYILDLYPQTDEFLSYYLIRYYIWYLLFSGKNATKEEFVEEYKRIKTFYHEKDIKAKFSPLSTKIKGEPLRNRLIVFIFLMMEKIHLIPFFACFYCKG